MKTDSWSIVENTLNKKSEINSGQNSTEAWSNLYRKKSKSQIKGDGFSVSESYV